METPALNAIAPMTLITLRILHGCISTTGVLECRSIRDA